MFSGRTTRIARGESVEVKTCGSTTWLSLLERSTGLIAFKVREHGDLRCVSGHARVERFATHGKNHRKEQSCGHKDRERE